MKPKIFLKNVYKKNSRKKKSNNFDIIINNINNYNGSNYVGNKGLITNIIYRSNNNDNVIKENYNNYYTNLSMKKKNKKRKINSCEFIDEIKNIENLNKEKNKNNKKDKKMVNLTCENWKELCDKIYNKTKSTLEKYNNYLNVQIGKNDNLVQK